MQEKVFAACVVTLSLVLSAPTWAKDRLQRRFDQRDGLPVSEITQLAQDTNGFLWIGTRGGLVRFDGNEMRSWAPEVLAGEIVDLASGPNGEIIVGIERGDALRGRWKRMALYRVTDRSVVALDGPGGTPITEAVSAKFAADGSLWIALGDGLVRKAAEGSWGALSIPNAELVFNVVPEDGGHVLLIGESGVWRAGPQQVEAKLLSTRRASVALATPDGAIYVAEGGDLVPAELVRLAGGRKERLLQLAARPVALARRGSTVWAAFDRYLVALRPGEPPELVGPDAGLPSGGPLLIDQEGSLWLGTYQGLVQFPEPDTVIWTERDGLPSHHTTFMAPFPNPGDGFWLATWQGLGRMHHFAHGWQAKRESFVFAGGLCPDRQGRLWLTFDGAFREHSLENSTLHFYRGVRWPEFCAAAPDGTVWVLAPMGLFRTFSSSRAPRLVSSDFPNASKRNPGAILHDSQDRIWISESDTVCETGAAALWQSGVARWTCQQLPGAGNVMDLVEHPDGELWAATEQSGVWHYHSFRWVQFAESARTPYQKFGSLQPSSQGGVWLLSEGGVARVKERSDNLEKWDYLETLSSWQGVPSVSSLDLLEQPDGSVWITTVAGLIQLPVQARRAPMTVPRVHLVDVVSNGVHVSETAFPQLPFHHLLEIHFAALSFRDRSRLRYQVRAHANDPWQDISGEPILRYLDLRPDRYQVQVRASLDGQNWSTDLARFTFEVQPPWFRTGWALALFTLLSMSLLYAAHRVRMGMLLRLERQRGRIAMDLHDEMGSGLGSIRILAGLAADRKLPESERLATMNQIEEAADELGTALSEIVWSLRPGSSNLDAFITHLVERAARLFPGETPEFHSELPEFVPPIELSLATRRNLALTAIEALHNAARHARATQVVLGLTPAGEKWKLRIRDDGCGLKLPMGPSQGMGMRNMKLRADEIGAGLSWSASVNGGTTVMIVFDPGSNP